MEPEWMNCKLKPKVDDFVSHADVYHKAYYDSVKPGRLYYNSEKPGGPAHYFHIRALTVANLQRKIELIYALLPTWGMHRGNPGPRMNPFDDFRKSIFAIRPEIEELSNKSTDNISPDDWEILKSAFKGLKVMETRATLIGNSKVLAHLLPDLVAPVDRNYTLICLFEKDIYQNEKYAWDLMRKIHEEFYHPIVNDTNFKSQAHRWRSPPTRYHWDTSMPKIVDNLVIGAKRLKRNASGSK